MSTLWDSWTLPHQAPLSWNSPGKNTQWVVISSSRGASWPRGQTWVSCIAGRFFTIWATREALMFRENVTWLPNSGLCTFTFPHMIGSAPRYLQWLIPPFNSVISSVATTLLKTVMPTTKYTLHPFLLYLPFQHLALSLISLEKAMATHSSILAWRIPWPEEPGVLQSMGLQRVRHDWTTNTHIISFIICHIIYLAYYLHIICILFILLISSQLEDSSYILHYELFTQSRRISGIL